jgi:hypothetical protein
MLGYLSIGYHAKHGFWIFVLYNPPENFLT